MNYCPKCGARINDNMRFCPECGAELLGNTYLESTQQDQTSPQSTGNTPSSHNQASSQSTFYTQADPCQNDPNKPLRPDNYLIMAILVTIFCCLPFGIVGIIKASDVNGLYDKGRYEEAEKASADAKKWSMISLLCGVAIVVIYIILALIGLGSVSEYIGGYNI